jgi:hypothetical protein
LLANEPRELTMLLHVGLLVESLAAVAAWIRPRITVDQQMSRQGAAPLERFSTLLTLIGEERKRRKRLRKKSY